MTIGYGTHQPCEQYLASRVFACPPRRKPWVLVTAILGSSLAFIEGSVVNLALPAIQSEFGATFSSLQWVMNSYLLVLGTFMLIGGSLGDRYGLRRIFMYGTALFGLGALACALAPSMAWLIAARAVQGFGGALLVPTSLALISSHFEEHERGRAIGTWAGASALTTALGPVLGGAVVDLWGWPAAFALIAPVAGLTLLVASWRVPASPVLSRERLDIAGALLLAVALALFIHALTTPRTPVLLCGEIVSAIVFGCGFIWRERHVAAPMLPLSLFRSRAFSGANAMTLALYCALGGALYFLPFNLIQVHGYSALQAGAAFLPFTLIMGLGSTFAGGLIRRFAPRRILTLGPLVTAGGFLALAIPGMQANFARGFLPGIVLVGIGMTLSVAPLTTVVMGAVDKHHTGAASGINNTAARLAGVLAVAMLTAVAVVRFSQRLDERLPATGVPETTLAQLRAHADRLALLSPPRDVSGASALRIRNAIAQSYVETFRSLMLICALLAAFSAAIAWLSLANPGTDTGVKPDPA